MEDNKVIVIELTSRKIRILVGYELDNKVYVLCTVEKFIPRLIENGVVIDPVALGKEIVSMKNVNDPQLKVDINVNKAYLILPPCGLEVFETSQITTVISDKCRVNRFDIQNLYALIKNCKIPCNNKLIDIVPLNFGLDDGRVFEVPPFEQESRTITIKARVHTLPPRICDGYYEAFKYANIEIIHSFIAPFVATELINTYENIPEDYILVDIGSDITSISVVSKRLLFASTTINVGGGNITDRIASEFNISVFDAEKYKILYGIDNRVMNFKVPVCESLNINGEMKKHYSDELNNIIKSELDTFIKTLNAAIDKLFINQNGKDKRLPLFLTGGGSLLNGLIKYLEPKVESNVVKTLTPTSLGARDPSYFNCLGALFTSKKYPVNVEQSNQRITSIQREALKENKDE